MANRPAVMFVCVHNAGKSQMAAALMRHLAGDRIEVHSAGTDPGTEVHDVSAAAVAELGADMFAETPRAIDQQLLARMDRVIVVGTHAEVAPIGRISVPLETWLIDDPSTRGIEGLERVRIMRDEIAARVRVLLAQLCVN